MKWPKAVAKIEEEELVLTFYDYPAEHWVHLRTTNPIEESAKIWKATISERPDPDPQGPRECLSSDLSSAAEFVALLLERDGRDFIEACISEEETHRSYVRLVSALACEVVAIRGRKSMDLAESAGNGVSVTLGVDDRALPPSATGEVRA